MKKKCSLKLISILLLLCFVGSSSGCVSLKGNTAYEYVPGLPKGTVPVSVSFEEFADMRPEKDTKQTKNIEPVAAKVTRKVYDDFRQSELFEKVLSGSDANADLLVKGRIYNFYWKNRYKWYVFVPYINLIILFGVPAGQFSGEVKIALDLVNKKTNAVVASYETSELQQDTYTGYRTFWGLETGTETSEAFRIVMDRIKSDILKDKDKIVSAL